MKITYDLSLVKNREISKAVSKLTPYLKVLRGVNGYHDQAGFINLPIDKKFLREAIEVKESKVSRNLKYILVIGIGGSDLGTKAIYEGLYGQLDYLNRKRYPKILFIETNNKEQLIDLKNFLGKQVKKSSEILINVVSKSGETVETINDFNFVYTLLKKKFKNIEDRIVVTSSFGSKLFNFALENGIETLTIPQNVGGRFSVFSSVGLFPLLACKVNINKFLSGGRMANKKNLVLKNSPAAISASLIYLNLKSGKNVYDSFIFNPALESLGKWYRQVIAESVGKNKTIKIIPTISIGSTDLHSLGQLYLSGPKNRFTCFVSTMAKKRDAVEAILKGVKASYKKRGLAFMEIELKAITPQELGEFMEFKMIETILLAKLLGVNAFNQPAVELYKKETRKVLKRK